MRLLDLFCGAGGAGMGYHRAGFDVTGVDIADHGCVYPFTFLQDNALDVLADADFIAGFDAVHASPPCQAYSPLNAYNKVEYPDLINEVRDLLIASGLPYVIENVVQAPLLGPITLCGDMFGGRYYRHRAFESNMPLLAPKHPAHVARCARNGYLPTPERPYMSIHGGRHSRAWLIAAADALGVDWMVTNDTAASIRGVCEAIPPAYTRFLGRQLAATLHFHTEEEAEDCPECGTRNGFLHAPIDLGLNRTAATS